MLCCQIEEQILESLVWRRESPVWHEINALKADDKTLPTYEEVKLPDEEGVGQALLSPSGRGMHTAVRRLLGQDKVQIKSKSLTINMWGSIIN